MCSTGVCFGVWLFSFIKLTSNCRGVLESRRIRSVSGVIFNGMRLSTTILSGRMSCVVALELSITKIFSRISMSIAGNLSGMRSGIAAYFNKAKLEHWHANKRQGACILHLAFALALCKGSNFWRNEKAETRVRRGEWLTKQVLANSFIGRLINLSTR